MGRVQVLPPSERGRLAALLAPRSISDSMAAYYALDHGSDRVTLYAHFHQDGKPNAFLVVARTGLDLFRPLVIPFAGNASQLQDLIKSALAPDYPVLIDLPVGQRPMAEEVVELQYVQEAEILRLDPSLFVPQINVLVVESRTPDGWPRFEIHSGEVLQAAAGLNWRGDHFAEVYVEARPAAVERGHHSVVLGMMAGYLLGERRIALYRADDHDGDIKADAFQLGFKRTGNRRVLGQAILRNDTSGVGED